MIKQELDLDYGDLFHVFLQVYTAVGWKRVPEVRHTSFNGDVYLIFAALCTAHIQRSCKDVLTDLRHPQ